ncbi:MAG: DNA photolyase family protein [Bacteroidales bacterium]|nr:DNA photolyase family protein [Bacteroidales bacterium]
MSFTIFWFRRDLRLHDNKAFFKALEGAEKVLPLFIFDEDILDPLPRNDHRVEFIHHTLSGMDQVLRKQGSGILVRKGKPFDVFKELLGKYEIDAVYCNADHEPYGMERDEKVRALLASHGIGFYQELDHLVLGGNEALKSDGTPYTVFTPYSRRWKEVLESRHIAEFPSETLLKNCHKGDLPPMPSLKELGFEPSGIEMPVAVIDEDLIRNYHETRNFPAINGVSRLSPHLRFGTISIRKLVKIARELNETFLNELIWREFYAMILQHFPQVVKKSFRPEYDRIEWRNNETEFELWKQGRTGFPMVDAGMRQLAATGYMHNRLRMVTASFLTKHLLIDWRWGEAWFAEKLFDFELSSNNGGWQWSAGTGTDAAPYFRIFNPSEQQKKFDPDEVFIKKWIPAFGTSNYPDPIVDHKLARERCLAAYKKALQP